MKIEVDLHPEVVEELKQYMKAVRQHREHSRTPRWLDPKIDEGEAVKHLVDLGLRWLDEHGVEEAERIPLPRGFVPLIVRDDAP